MLGLVRHSAEMKFCFVVLALPVKAVEKCGRSSAIETAIVKTESNLGHKERNCSAFPQWTEKAGTKPFKMDGSPKKVKGKGSLPKVCPSFR
jgi:hypothetical protein